MALISPGGIVISLSNEKIWRSFYDIGTEMVLTKTGRNLFPKLQYRISGLEPSRKYIAYLRFELVDNKKYKYKSGGWTATECCDPVSSPGFVMHPDGSKCGEHWMKTGLPFDRVKITNNSDDPRDNVLLQSMRKYRPVVSLYYADESLPYSSEMIKVAEYSTNIQDFIAVTAYQNTRITELKIKNNPYAKGFREGPKSRKRSLSSTGTTPSPEIRWVTNVKNEYYMGQQQPACGAAAGGGNQLQQNSPQFPFQQPSPMYQSFYQYQTSPQMFPQLPSTPTQFYQPVGYYQNPWTFSTTNAGQIWFQSPNQQLCDIPEPKEVDEAEAMENKDANNSGVDDGGGGGGYSCAVQADMSENCKQFWVKSGI